ncbi:hypothetical protein [Amycolatopsis sp. CA-230715]|uniref:hypothetical protein n=1 Tax=Amycolatopsis sp. CA-230715 TaxID=2745196 RepID=UPI001C00B20C|nr:hypothetical protein [Amycolatopsis sp. CA-230715]QWF77910.1 hypothetical protein HUW46_01303 [Amycolatopsis sp. CA-230715]
MARRRRYFGRVDPFCFAAVVPLLFAAGLFAVAESRVVCAICVVLAGLLLVFDSWVNRPEPPPVRRRAVRPRG